MSLKQECVDFIKLTMEPLQESEEFMEYALEEDSYRDICTLTGRDITYSDCSGCEHSKCESKYGKDTSCPYLKEHFKVDVSFWDYADFERNYIFAGGKEGRIKGVTYINSRKQFMEDMAVVKKELESFRDYRAKFGEMYWEFMDYAKEFVEYLSQEYSFFSLLNPDVLPMVFHTDNAKDADNKYDFLRRGDVSIYEKQIVINCYCCMEDKRVTMKFIRHELLHYALYIAGMKFKDDTAIFHYLCDKYDAHAYKKLPEEEQKLFDKLKMIIRYFDGKDKDTSDTEEIEKCRKQLIEILLMVTGDYKKLPKVYDNCVKMYDIMYDMAKTDNAA